MLPVGAIGMSGREQVQLEKERVTWWQRCLLIIGKASVHWIMIVVRTGNGPGMASRLWEYFRLYNLSRWLF